MNHEENKFQAVIQDETPKNEIREGDIRNIKLLQEDMQDLNIRVLETSKVANIEEQRVEVKQWRKNRLHELENLYAKEVSNSNIFYDEETGDCYTSYLEYKFDSHEFENLNAKQVSNSNIFDDYPSKTKEEKADHTLNKFGLHKK